jgi:anti-anti-sigma factor
MKLILESREADHVKVACEGNLTVMPSTGQGDDLQQVVGANCFQQMVLLNMARTDYVDSSGISWLLVTHGRFVESGGNLVVHSATPRVRGTFELLRLPTVLHLARDEAGARALLTGGKS